MGQFKTYVENRLNKNSVAYRSSRLIYRLIKRIQDNLMRFYIGLCEFFIPASFYIQSTPNSILKNYYSSFRRDSKIYSSKSNQITRDGVRLISAKLLLDLVYNLEEGDYAELGTYQGNFAKLIFKNKNPDSSLYCFDTFEGFLEKDVNIELSETKLKTKSGHFSDTSFDLVTRNITGNTVENDKLKLIKGYFPNTFDGMENKKWRFVQLDADLYEPMKEGAKAFWPNIVKGGVLLIHDYNGPYVGTKKAIDEYFKPLGIVPIPLPDKVGSAVIIKN